MQVQSYLTFEGRCEEALEFYRKALGAEIKMVMRFKDAPGDACAEAGNGEKIMHAAFQVGDTEILASDGRCVGNGQFHGFGLSLSLSTDEDARKKFAALSAGGSVEMPLGNTFFASTFGIAKDPFGVCWMVIVPAAVPA